MKSISDVLLGGLAPALILVALWIGLLLLLTTHYST